MSDEVRPRKTFCVQIGHTAVSVECTTEEEAIRRARMKLSSELPRLYDVIHRIDDTEFRVDEAH